MVSFGKKVVKFRIPILIICILLLIPAIFGYLNTRVNYDILSYLPKDIETMEGQDILVDEFGTGGFAMYMVDGMTNKDTSKLKSKIEDVDGVANVVWLDSITDLSVPESMLPDEVLDAFQSGDTTLMYIIFEETSSTDKTLNAVKEIRQISNEQCFLSGMSGVIQDTKELSDQEVPIYVLIAVLLSAIVLALCMDSYLVPFLFLLSIGFAIIFNLGTNFFKGEISYITQALTAVLQLAVTMDYSIFLWHAYEEQKVRYDGDKQRAMAHAISGTARSVFGSSITTMAGFIALCFMSFTLGLDLGFVMAKGVLIGLIICITLLPALILIFDKPLVKTAHKPLLRPMPRFSNFVIKHYKVFIAIFIIVIIPAYYAQSHNSVYYQLDNSLPRDLTSIVANEKLKDDFDMTTSHMVIFDSSLEPKKIEAMSDEIKQVNGVKSVLSLEDAFGSEIPSSMIPEDLTKDIKNDTYEVMLINSGLAIASDEANEQVETLDGIIKNYDPSAMLIGEEPCTNDLISITDRDFKVVSAISIAAVFMIILLIYGSITLPVILVATIEFAIFINMGIPYVTGDVLPFIAGVVISTIQLGSTVDYAILMTTRYSRERRLGNDKIEATRISHQATSQSIIVSAFSFFAATFGVGLYSQIDMISSLCMLMARGALISMVVVILVLPAMFIIFDGLIVKTSRNFGPKQRKIKRKKAKNLA